MFIELFDWGLREISITWYGCMQYSCHIFFFSSSIAKWRIVLPSKRREGEECVCMYVACSGRDEGYICIAYFLSYLHCVEKLNTMYFKYLIICPNDNISYPCMKKLVRMPLENHFVSKHTQVFMANGQKRCSQSQQLLFFGTIPMHLWI